MSLEIFETSITDCKLFKPAVFEDERGYFYEGFNKAKLRDELGIDFNIVQINQSKSQKNVLRGLHFQIPPFDQAKLVSVIEGEVIDVAVDLRQDSPSYGKHEKVILSSENKHHFYIPKGFAHGFLVLSDSVKFMYGVDQVYSPAHDSGLKFDDPDISINWGVNSTNFIISEKDKNLGFFEAFSTPF